MNSSGLVSLKETGPATGIRPALHERVAQAMLEKSVPADDPCGGRVWLGLTITTPRSSAIAPCLRSACVA
jgi:hypothetical protein